MRKYPFHAKCSYKSISRNTLYKVSVRHLRINSAACRRFLALLRAFIPRHAACITMTVHTHNTHIYYTPVWYDILRERISCGSKMLKIIKFFTRKKYKLYMCENIKRRNCENANLRVGCVCTWLSPCNLSMTSAESKLKHNREKKVKMDLCFSCSRN